MPSKTKKHSKSQSNLSHSKHQLLCSSSSSRTSPSPSSVLTEEEDLSRTLEEASRRYPSLIGKSALVGRLTDVETTQSRGCKLWISEVSMVSSNISPGSTVSVSLASLDKVSSSFPVISFADECARYYGLESQNKISNEAGHYFALATIFPSCKILKNGVRLSSNLSGTMGCPAPGSILFIYPIQSQSQTGPLNGKHKQHKDLYLELVPSRDGLKINFNMLSPVKCPPKSTLDRFENGSVASPKTPSLHQSKLKSPSSSSLSSPICDELVSSLPDPNRTSFNSAELSEVFGDEKAKKLLQSCATSWLNSRSLLCGNFVAIPILSNLCIFCVVGPGKLPADIGNTDLTNKRGCKIFPTTCISVDNVSGAFIVNHETKINLILPQHSEIETLQKGESHMVPRSEDVKAIVGHDTLKLGGLSKEYVVLKDIISSSVKDTLSSLGLRTTKGVLLQGPPGTGKTSLARLCARDAGINLFSVNGPEIVSQYYGESEKALHEVFDSASQAAPAVVFIDELDAIAPTRKEGGDELSQRLVATLLNLMDGISRTDGILVVAATNRPDSIEPALRRPGRLDWEIEIGVPSPTQRLDILIALLSDMDHCLIDLQIQQLATATHGFVGADLATLCNEAALVCLRRHVKFEESCVDLHSGKMSMACDICSDAKTGGFDFSRDLQDLVLGNQSDSTSSSTADPPVSSKILSPFSIKGAASESADYIPNGVKNSVVLLREKAILKITYEDFENARRKVRPSAMREVILEVPKVKWEDVGGQKEVKRQLMEAVEWPQKHLGAFKRIGVRPPTGVLMFGPPGCSKTLMARAVASEAGLNFLAVKGPELFSKWVGESEKAVRSLFAKARANAPSIIFFDEIDGLAVIRGKESDGISVADRVMSQLLVELDGLHQRVDVTVIAATNRPDKIDPAILRPGRFDRLLYVGPPNETEREDIFRIHLRKIPCSSDVNARALSCLTEGCTGADIFLICREAAVAAIEESFDASEITMEHLKTAIRQVQPSEIQSFHELSAKFQRLVHSHAAGEGLGQPCVHKLNWISFWTRMKSIMQLLYQFPAAFSWTKSHSTR